MKRVALIASVVFLVASPASALTLQHAKQVDRHHWKGWYVYSIRCERRTAHSVRCSDRLRLTQESEGEVSTAVYHVVDLVNEAHGKVRDIEVSGVVTGEVSP